MAETVAEIREAVLMSDEPEASPLTDNEILTAAQIVKIAFENVNSKPERTAWADGYFVDLIGYLCKGYFDEEGSQKTKWVSDGYAYIDCILENITNGSIERSFVIAGKPVHCKEFRLTIGAKDVSEGRKLRAALVNEFGIDQLGHLELPVIQTLSDKSPRHIKLIGRPQWLDGQMMAPGLTADDVEYHFERKVAVSARGS